MIKIGYQGIRGSFCQKAVKEFIAKNDFNEVNILPLVSSDNVFYKLDNGIIDYAVVALHNSIGGEVQETKKVVEGKNEYELIDTITIDIHHCLYVKDSSVKLEDVDTIISHPQAIKQCGGFIKDVYTKLIEDTAIGAFRMAKDYYQSNSGVICSKGAGKLFNLHLLEENIENTSDNRTTFGIFVKRDNYEL